MSANGHCGDPGQTGDGRWVPHYLRRGARDACLVGVIQAPAPDLARRGGCADVHEVLLNVLDPSQPTHRRGGVCQSVGLAVAQLRPAVVTPALDRATGDDGAVAVPPGAHLGGVGQSGHGRRTDPEVVVRSAHLSLGVVAPAGHRPGVKECATVSGAGGDLNRAGHSSHPLRPGDRPPGVGRTDLAEAVVSPAPHGSGGGERAGVDRTGRDLDHLAQPAHGEGDGGVSGGCPGGELTLFVVAPAAHRACGYDCTGVVATGRDALHTGQTGDRVRRGVSGAGPAVSQLTLGVLPPAFDGSRRIQRATESVAGRDLRGGGCRREVAGDIDLERRRDPRQHADGPVRAVHRYGRGVRNSGVRGELDSRCAAGPGPGRHQRDRPPHE